jgi:YD repeat-containing protein
MWDTTDTYDAATNILWRDHHWVAPSGLTLTDPNGAVSDISTTIINDKVYLTGRSQPAGAGCSASTSSQAFDVNGVLSRRDDFNGTRSCYANDLQRKLPITSVEGLAQTDACSSATQASSLPANSRMTSTEWHPDWPLPVRQAGPNLLTTWVYNGQSDPFNANQIASCAAAAAALPDGKPLPLLCKRVAQATLDNSGTKRFALAGKAAVPADPNGVDPSYASVSLLLHMDGSSSAAGLVDSSVNGYAVGAFGNAGVNTGAARYGSGGLALDGSQGSYVTAPSAALDVGANDFTAEAWVRLNAYGNNATVLSNFGPPGARGFEIVTSQDGGLATRWSQDGSDDRSILWHSQQLALNTWAHVAVARQGTALRIFLNGVSSAPVTINGAIYTPSTPVNIGRTPDTGSGAWYLNGAVDDVRITKGVARYTAAFTPPTAALPGRPATPAVPSLFNAAVADRVQRWTYDQDGRVLTSKSTRGGVTVTTSSSYFADTDANHTKGDLQSITSSTGEVTTFTQYNRAGQVLQRIDANGVVTVNTYDLRQRLLTTATDGLMTTYEYDAAGQLKKATLPNGSWVGQDYDDARRLKAVYDDQGNRIDYELDNSGQQIGQTTKDPNGSLKASLARAMDALSRAQRTTGGEE